MRIIIVGAGAVGTHLAKLLSRENIDITLLDESAERLNNLDVNYDMLTQVGSPTSIRDLKDARVKDVNLFVAVTPQESVNMTACMIAHNLGAKKTLARIDNPEYLLPKHKDFFKNLGVDHLIYPEELAAREITESLRTSWIRSHLEFCNGALELFAIKIRANASIINKKFSSGLLNHGKFRVVAIKRNSETIIPIGNDEILANDLVYFVTTKKDIDFLREQAGKSDTDVKDIIFLGGGRIAQKTAQRICKSTRIKILEKCKERSFYLSDKLENTLVMNVDGRNVETLKEIGASEADAFVSLTGNSETNILACLAAKRLGIDKTIAEVENIDYIPLAESLDIGAVLNKKMIAASYIYQLTLDADVLNVHNLTSADAVVVEFIATSGSKITKQQVKDIKLPYSVNIGGLVRNGVGMTVNGDTQVQANDQIIVFCVTSALRKLEKYFN